MRQSLLGLLVLVVGCAPLAAEHKGDAAFRQALAAQLGHDDARAEALYREVIALGLEWSPVWNNLAVIAVHRHRLSEARRMLAQAVAANASDVVALTNYGVISYHLSDYREARKTLDAARLLRRKLLDSIPSGPTGWQEAQFEHATASLDATAAKYLARIDRAQLSDAPLPARDGDWMADLQVRQTVATRF